VRCVLNNGLDAGEDPTNVFGSDRDLASLGLHVLNEGCELYQQCVSVHPTEARIAGATILFAVAEGTSRIEMLDGSLKELHADDASWVSLRGGIVEEELVATQGATIEMSGGTADSLQAQQMAQAHLSGGNVSALIVGGQGVITIYGDGFALNGTPVGFGSLPAQPALLTGTLMSGEPLHASIVNPGPVSFGTIVLTAPEPSTLVGSGAMLASLSVIALLRRGRLASQRSHAKGVVKTAASDPCGAGQGPIDREEPLSAADLW
jgi:hypothetical protein